MRVQRGAVAASDHHLVLARMKMKLKKKEVKRNTRTQYNVDFLMDRVTTETFRITVRNIYEALQDLDEGNIDIDTQWQHIKEMWTSTCSEVLGNKKYQQKDWISADTVKKVQKLVRKRKVQLTTAEREQQKQHHRRSIQSSQEQRKNRQGKLH